MSIESRMILETARKLQEEAREAMIAPRRESEAGKGVDGELQRLLFQVLGALNHASHMITQVLARGQPPARAQDLASESEDLPPAPSGAPQPSAPERAPEYDPPPAHEETPRRRAPRGSFRPGREELRALRETLTVKAIGEKYGVSMATVMNRLREAGLTTPRETGRRTGRPRKG